MKKALCLITAALLFLLAGQAAPAAKAEVILLPEEVLTNSWYQDARSRLKVGNPTPLRGQFFTTMWGGTTSDLDVQDLLHACSPVLWDSELGRFRFDRSVVQDAAILNNKTEEISRAVKDMRAHGFTKDGVDNCIQYFKKDYLNATGDRKIKLRDALTKAYKANGMTADQALRTIDSWKTSKKKK